MRELSIILRTSDYRGDHSADVLIVQQVKRDETVKQLAERLLKADCDWIEIRLVKQDKVTQ